VTAGEDLLVSPLVDNVGTQEAGALVTLEQVGGQVLDSQYIQTDGSQSPTLTWSTSAGDAGTYLLRVRAGFASETVTVTVTGTGAVSSVVDNFENSPDGPYAAGDSPTDFYAGGLENINDFVRQTNDVGEGNISMASGSNPEALLSDPDGYQAVPAVGDTWSALLRSENISETRHGFGWFVQNASQTNTSNVTIPADREGYYAVFNGRGGELQLIRTDGAGSQTTLTSTSVTWSNYQSDWLEFVVDSSSVTGGTQFDLTVYEWGTATGRGASVATISATDGALTSGGVAWFEDNNGPQSSGTLTYGRYVIL
jgi:hypothetical protein